MKTSFALISDTHGYRVTVPEADVLLHAGDGTRMGTHAQVEALAEWLGALPHEHKVFVPGNHDTYTAGGGRDQFRFLPSALGPADTNSFAFFDFDPAAGEVLDLTRIDAIAGTLANDAFTLIGTAPFSGAPGELRWQYLGTGTLLVEGNVNADLETDLTLTLAMAGPVRSWWIAL